MVNYTFSKSFGSDFLGIRRHIEFINVMFWAIRRDSAQDEKRVSELNCPAFAQLNLIIQAFTGTSNSQMSCFGQFHLVAANDEKQVTELNHPASCPLL